MTCRQVASLCLLANTIWLIPACAQQPLRQSIPQSPQTKSEFYLSDSRSLDTEDTEKGVYGKDNRQEAYLTDAQNQRAASGTAAFFLMQQLEKTSSGYRLTQSHTLQEDGWCAAEPFVSQPSDAFCSGFLIDHDILVTAGHCLHNIPMKDIRVVFGFQLAPNKTAPKEFSDSEVFQISEILEHKLDNSSDWGVVRLNRPVPGHALPIIRQGDVPIGTEITVIGYPLGLPLKISEGGKVFDNKGNTFLTNLDAYHGNSGSPVFNSESIRKGKPMVEGILVSGADDYHVTPEGCKISNQCANDRLSEGQVCSGEKVTKISRVISLDAPSTTSANSTSERQPRTNPNQPTEPRTEQPSPDEKSDDICKVVPSLC